MSRSGLVPANHSMGLRLVPRTDITRNTRSLSQTLLPSVDRNSIGSKVYFRRDWLKTGQSLSGQKPT